jgi:hypothetical protein
MSLVLLIELSSYASWTFIFEFADPKDPSLRKLENSFLLGPVLVYARLLYFLTLFMHAMLY